MPGLLRCAVLALFLCAFWARSAQAAEPLAGIDCDCDSVGDFVLPKSPVAIETADGLTGLSPNGNFTVDAEQQQDGSALISVTEVGASTPAVFQVPGVAWGFSPDEDERFVVYYRVAGLVHARVYNLVGPMPQTPIIQTDSLGASGRVAFSPHGHHALVMWLPSDGPDHFALRVLDARTGALRHADQLIFSSPTGLPPGSSQVGSVRVGFGPDEEDRSLVYAWIAPTLQKSLRLVNLTPGAVQTWGDAQSSAFTWGFSRCGDRFSTVWESVPLQQKLAYLQSTLDFAYVGNVPFPISSTAKLTTTSAQHSVVLTAETLKLADNGADTACSVTPAPAPVAAFSVGAPKLNGVPLAFSDASAPTQGTLALWHWSFGDGSFSSEQNPSHVFVSAGTYQVQLTVTNSGGRASSLTKPVVIAVNQVPVPSFTYAPQPAMTRDSVTFTSTSSDDDGIASAYWTLGENTGSGSTFTSKVCAPSADVTLTVVDHAGQSAELQVSIPVGGSSFIPVAPGDSLQAAADGACFGDTLLLSAGTYAGGINLWGVNLQGSGPGQTFVFGAGDVATSKGWVLKLEASRVESLSITGGTLVLEEFREHGGGVSIMRDVTLDDVEVADNAGRAGVFLENNAEGVVVTDSALHDNDSVGIVLGCCSELTVARTEIAFHRVGVAIDETGGVLIEDNDFHDNEWALDIGASARVFGNRFHENGAAINARSGSLELAGNLIVNNQRGVIGPDYGAAIVTSSTIADNCEFGVQSRNGELLVLNSIVTGNGTDVEGVLSQSASNLIGTRGLFASDSDFHLAAGSAAIDAGDATYLRDWLTKDGDADERSAAALDIGWDEWTPAQPTMNLALPSCEPNGGAPSDGGAAGAPSDGGASSEGGAPGQGGAPTDGGVASEAGATGVGASGTTNGGTTNGGTTNGGTRPGVGGSPSDSGGAGGDDDGDGRGTVDDGCSCRLGTRAGSPFAPWLLGSALWLWLARRRSSPRA